MGLIHLKHGIGFLARTFLRPFILQKGDCNILMFHRVLKMDEFDNEDPFLVLTTEEFEERINLVQKYFRIVDLYTWIQNPTNEPCCALTFDDGWIDNYKNAYPILRKYNLPATIFLSTGMIGTMKRFWFDELQLIVGKINFDEIKIYLSNKFPGISTNSHYEMLRSLIVELKKKSTKEIDDFINDIKDEFKIDIDSKRTAMSWDMINEMGQHKISFASHGVNHVLFTALSNDEKRFEIMESKKTIESNVKNNVPLLSFPNGDYDQKVLEYAEDARYLAMFTASINHNDSIGEGGLILNRINVSSTQSFNLLFFKMFLSKIYNKTPNKKFIELLKSNRNKAR